jgi:hypothetical protein
MIRMTLDINSSHFKPDIIRTLGKSDEAFVNEETIIGRNKKLRFFNIKMSLLTPIF